MPATCLTFRPPDSPRDAPALRQRLRRRRLAALLGRATGRASRARAAVRHHPAEGEVVIFLYMDGGPSQVDTFDHKPLLEKYHGQDPHTVFKVEPTQFNNVGKVMASPWKFKQHGECGQSGQRPVPARREVRGRPGVRPVDDVRSSPSTRAPTTSCTPAPASRAGRAWGRGSATGSAASTKDLPGFIVLNGGLIPPGGLDNFNSGFLPAAYQGSVFRAGDPPVANVVPLETDRRPTSAASSTCCRSSTPGPATGSTAADEIESAIANYETAFRMQAAVPELMDLQGRVGRDQEAVRPRRRLTAQTRIFGRQCLIARRLVERGVRFVELTCPAVGARPLGPARRPEERARGQRPRRRPADRRPARPT